MASINSSNYYSVSASTNKGMSGLVSNMDTESMVQQMLSGTQGKIDKQNALKQQAEWRQEIYRDMITSINDFRNKYFDTSYGSNLATNFASASFFDSMTSSVTSGDAVKVISTGSGAMSGDVSVIVNQLAEKANLSSAQKMSTNKITGADMTAEKLKGFEKKLVLKVSGSDDPIEIDLNTVNTEQGMVNTINDALAGKGVTAKIFDGRLRLVTDQNVKVSLASGTTSKALEMTGFGSLSTTNLTDASGALNGKMMLQGGQVKAEAGVSFNITLDGVQKSITLNNVQIEYKKNTDGSDLIENGSKVIDVSATALNIEASLQDEVEKAFGSYIKVGLATDEDGNKLDHFEISYNENGVPGSSLGHQVLITELDAGILGINPGSTTTLNSGSKLSELKGLGLQGDRFQFTINGKDFSFSGDTSIGSMINTVNNSGAGVKMSYSSLSDTFSIEATSSGAHMGIEMSQKEGNLLSVMFGADNVAGSSSVGSKQLTVDTIKGTALADDFETKEISLKMKVNGANHTFSLSAKKNADGSDYMYGKREIEESLNAWLKSKFGTIDDTESGAANISYDAATGSLKILKDSMIVSFDKTTVDQDKEKDVAEAKKTDLAFALGFNTEAKSNIATADSKVENILQLKSMVADGTLTTGTKVGDLTISTGGGTVTFEDGRLTLNNDKNSVVGKPLAQTVANGSLSLEVDGTIHTFTLSPKGDGSNYNSTEVKNAFNQWLKSEFGTTSTGTPNFSYTKGDGKLTIQGDHTVSVPEDTSGTGLASIMGLSGKSNSTVSLDGTLASLFGGGSFSFSDGASTKRYGKDAEVVINGVETTRSSNTFEVDGLTLEITKVSEKTTNADGIETGVATIINTAQDTEKIVEGFKTFVDDYNAMIKKLNDYVGEKANYRQYDPLTSEQKKEMSEREIELWEEKAKQGLVRNDASTETFLSQMRLALYSKPAGAAFALYDIGIETGGYKEKGQLHLDEAALRNALAADPGAIKTLFTDSENGLAALMTKAMKAAAELSSGSQGSLVQIAGYEGYASETNNNLSNTITSINSRLKDLQAKYEKERTRYWNQFNSMEQIMANFNNQSMMISNQFSGY